MAAAIRKRYKLVLMIVMIVYLVMLCYFLFFSEAMGRTSDAADYRYNLVLFKEIRRFITQWEKVGMRAAFINIAGNVGAFMPFGALAACLLRPREKWYVITFLSLLLSFFVELMQLVTRLGCFDVDDLLLNTIGGWMGYVVYVFVRFLYGRLPFRESIRRKEKEYDRGAAEKKLF